MSIKRERRNTPNYWPYPNHLEHRDGNGKYRVYLRDGYANFSFRGCYSAIARQGTGFLCNVSLTPQDYIEVVNNVIQTHVLGMGELKKLTYINNLKQTCFASSSYGTSYTEMPKAEGKKQYMRSGN